MDRAVGVQDGVAADILDEFQRARQKHGAMASPHEGYAVILEEMDELWSLVKADLGDTPMARGEAIQIAAMALAYVVEVCDG